MDCFNLYGLVIMIVIIIPNIIFSIKVKNGFENKFNNKAIELLEQIGRFGTFGLMIFNIPTLTKGYWFSNAESIYVIVNSILTLSYCLIWIMFFEKKCLLKSLLLSITPSVIFVFSGITLLNIPLIILSVLFSVCHITISYKNAVN